MHYLTCLSSTPAASNRGRAPDASRCPKADRPRRLSVANIDRSEDRGVSTQDLSAHRLEVTQICSSSRKPYEVLLRFNQGAAVGATGTVGERQLDEVVFPEADRTDF